MRAAGSAISAGARKNFPHYVIAGESLEAFPEHVVKAGLHHSLFLLKQGNFYTGEKLNGNFKT